MFAVFILTLQVIQENFINNLNSPYSVDFGDIIQHMIYGDNWKLLLHYSAALTLMFRPLIQFFHLAENKL